MAIVKATNHVECPPKERHIRSELFCFIIIIVGIGLVIWGK